MYNFIFSNSKQKTKIVLPFHTTVLQRNSVIEISVIKITQMATDISFFPHRVFQNAFNI